LAVLLLVGRRRLDVDQVDDDGSLLGTHGHLLPRSLLHHGAFASRATGPKDPPARSQEYRPPRWSMTERSTSNERPRTWRPDCPKHSNRWQRSHTTTRGRGPRTVGPSSTISIPTGGSSRPGTWSASSSS